MEGFDNVGHTMFKFYKDLLGAQPATRTPLDMEVISHGSVLISEQQIYLCKPFTNKDIKEAIWSIPNPMSPGPDGLSSGFYKSTWEQNGHLVCTTVQDFFSAASLP